MHPKVLDFGISKGNDAVTQAGTLTGTGAMIGTPYYLAPEQIMDSKSAGSASDQYALGIILYECLTGKRPYDGENLFVVFQGIVGGTPKRPREYRPEIPQEMEDVTLRAMKVDPKQRFATIEDFGRALLPFASARARMIWDEAFSGGPASEVPPGRPSIAVMPTPSPPTRASTLMPPGMANPGPHPRVVDAGTARDPEPFDLAAHRRRDADASAQDDRDVGMSPNPQPRVPTGATLPGSPESNAARPGAAVDGDVEVASGLHRRRGGRAPAPRARGHRARRRAGGAVPRPPAAPTASTRSPTQAPAAPAAPAAVPAAGALGAPVPHRLRPRPPRLPAAPEPANPPKPGPRRSSSRPRPPSYWATASAKA